VERLRKLFKRRHQEDILMRTNKRLIAYWATTGVVAFELIVGGLTDLVHGRTVLVVGPPVVEVVTQLGYPVYLLTILGCWKLLGAVALLVPRFPRLKEWAYAGTFFEMTGAVASHVASGMYSISFIWALIVAVFTLMSWALRPPSRILGALIPTRTDASSHDKRSLSSTTAS
jgi:uncharacterized membrane protein YphA (DoxX/SURF4 family)